MTMGDDDETDRRTDSFTSVLKKRRFFSPCPSILIDEDNTDNLSQSSCGDGLWHLANWSLCNQFQLTFKSYSMEIEKILT